MASLGFSSCNMATDRVSETIERSRIPVARWLRSGSRKLVVPPNFRPCRMFERWCEKDGKCRLFQCRSRPLFAHVLFARAVDANRLDRDKPRSLRLSPWRGSQPNPVQPGRDRRHVHLCKITERALGLIPLLSSVTGYIIRMVAPVLAPVIRVTFLPRALCVPLVVTVIGIGAELLPLPLTLSSSLTCRRGAVGLMWCLRARFEQVAAANTGLECHPRLLQEWAPDHAYVCKRD